jgi:5-methylcytosine-specific restriction endonuclease McrA
LIVNKHCHVCGKVKRSAGNVSTTCLDCEADGLKYCVHCETTKSLSDFERRKDKVGSICKKCKNAKQNARYQTDEMFKQTMLHSARQYSNNRYATDKEFRKAEQVRKQLRRATGSLTIEQWHDICKRYDYSCAYCGSPHNLTMDHVVPISKGGKTTSDNVIPACISCNSSKKDKDMLEWYKETKFFSEARLAKIMEWKGGASRVPKRS